MGVYELETFIQSYVDHGVKKVSIKAEIESFKRMHLGKQPILVFDVCSLVRFIGNDKEEILCAGRHQLYQQTLSRLFTRLSAIAELIFFQDGPVVDNKYQTWVHRQNKKYQNHLKIMDKLYEGQSLKNIVHKNSKTIYSNILLNIIEETCKKFGRLHCSVNSECDQEIARFCYMNHRVLGVFSNDTDFLIFPGHYRYFSTKDLNIEKLETKEFNRKVLQNELCLSNFQMGIFATLAGNDVVRHEDLTHFHERFDRKPKKKIPELAKYVKKVTKQYPNYHKMLQILSEKICGKKRNEMLEKLLDASIASYDAKSKSSSDIELNDDNQWSFLLQNHHLFTYSILNQLPINFSLVFFDLRLNDMPSYFDLCAFMFERQAGIVYWLTSVQEPYLTIYTKTSHEVSHGKSHLRPFFPPFEAPCSLVEIYSDDPTLDDLRFNLLKWSISWETLVFENLWIIPPNYLTSVLTLHFMVQQCILGQREADIILWTIKNAEEGTIPSNMKPPEFLHPRAFRIAFLFVKIYPNIARCIEVCGLKSRYSKPLSFDGVFFHNEYIRFMYEEFDPVKLLAF